MASESSQADEPDLSVEKCLDGDEAALTALRQQCHSKLAKILSARGATATETEDVLADLWADCIPGGEKPSLLEKFKGTCTLAGWLATVATNRWIDLKRRQERRGELTQRNTDDDKGTDLLERLPASLAPVTEESLLGLLRDSLQAAFASCPGDAVVLLRLVYVHGLSQREVGQMMGWGEWKVSRLLSQTMVRIEKETLQSLKKRDRWLDLTWQDFVELCQTYDLGFG
jgi:RNA polymerase sigma factor (sigma-70 family)